MGTGCTIEFAADKKDRGDAYQDAVLKWVTAFEAEFSRFRPDSLISKIPKPDIGVSLKGN
jgi:thiamine biosynthesis lipoprotein